MSRVKVLEGMVTSDKMNKTRVVEVTKRVPHHLYKKMVIRKKRYKVHDEENSTKVGDRVKIIGSRPFSKDKRYKLLEVVHRKHIAA